MTELEFSLMARGADTLAVVEAALKPFETKHHVQVHVTLQTWETGWTELVKGALYGHGADVSEVGSTWVVNLVAMNALRPFAAAEIAALGSPHSFFASTWRSGQAGGETTQWAIPWLVDTRLIYYRRNELQQAGIDTATAFDSPAAIAQTLGRLRAAGSERPWSVPTDLTGVTLHNAASWIWALGGDLMSADGKSLLLDQPETLAGVRAYFDLYRYLASPTPDFSNDGCDRMFREGRVPVTVSGPFAWMKSFAASEKTALSLALPRIPFIGGSHLVTWQYSHQRAAAMDLVSYLTSPAVQAQLCQHFGIFPARTDVWNTPPFSEASLRPLAERLKQAGRAFPPFSMWGLIEDKLKVALHDIWTEVLAAPEPDIEAILHRHIDPLAQRLSAALGR